MLIDYKCKCGNEITKFFRKASDIVSEITCECGKKLERQLSAPNSKLTMTVDNGNMARSVEVDSDLIEEQRQLVERGEK